MVSEEQKEYFLETLKRKNFNISAACSHCKVSRQWYYDRMSEDVDFSQRVREMEEKLLDDAEEMHAYLRRGILKTEVIEDGSRVVVGWEKEPDRHALQFFLLTKGKKRGYAMTTPMENTPRPGEVIIVELPDNGRGPKELPPGESAPAAKE